MKLRIVAAMCLVLIVASAMVVTTAAAGCDIDLLLPCLNASRDPRVKPDKRCCDAIRRFLPPRKQKSAIDCLCRLATSKEAVALKINLSAAIAIPQKCGIKFEQRFYCQGTGISPLLRISSETLPIM